MDRPVNIYSAVLFDLHPKIKALIDKLNTEHQIDHDEHGHPYVIGVENVGGSNRRIDFIRSGRRENIILNTRRRIDPVYSFNLQDGYQRLDAPRLPVLASPRGARPERQKKTFEAIAEQILGGNVECSKTKT